MKLTRFQEESQRILGEGKDLLLVAPTGLGKTLAVMAGLKRSSRKTVYAVPLRALGSGIREEIAAPKRNGARLRPVRSRLSIKSSAAYRAFR